MRKVVGFLTALIGVGAAIYFGVVIFLIGGIEQIIEGFEAEPVDKSKIAWAIVGIIYRDVFIGLGMMLAIAIGYLIAFGSLPGDRRRQMRKRQQRRRGPLLGGPPRSSRW